ncbi:MAG: hypothetical protein Q4C95_08945 [Planctomycetia bacterium]|nr:hypothetical protein [Planctomycetia bacterium]
MIKHFSVAFILFSCFLIAGCSKNVGMSGTVTFSDDNSPLTVGTICFQSDSVFSRGKMKPDGTFVIGSEKEADGLPKGEYVVFFSGATEQDGTDDSGMPVFKSVVDLKYTTPEETPLKISVAGKQKIDLKVDRPSGDMKVAPNLTE